MNATFMLLRRGGQRGAWSTNTGNLCSMRPMRDKVLSDRNRMMSSWHEPRDPFRIPSTESCLNSLASSRAIKCRPPGLRTARCGTGSGREALGARCCRAYSWPRRELRRRFRRRWPLCCMRAQAAWLPGWRRCAATTSVRPCRTLSMSWFQQPASGATQGSSGCTGPPECRDGSGGVARSGTFPRHVLSPMPCTLWTACGMCAPSWPTPCSAGPAR